MRPTTNYTKSGGINIAYQVFGSGAIDLVYIPGWVSNIDRMWACPELVGFLQELGKVARVILFDKRGTGLSDRVVEFSTLEERMDDIRAVMDAVGARRAVLFGHSEGGSVSALFAATYPNRTISLITFGIFAKRIYSPDYPWAPTPEERQVVYDMIIDNWGTGEMNLESLAPSKANDRVFMDWLASYFRSGASPNAALVLTKMNTEVDIIDILPSIKVPTLIIQRKGDIDVKVEEGQFIADRIESSRFVELEGDDHLFWIGDTLPILEEIKGFIAGVKPIQVHEKRLVTILSGHILSGDTNNKSFIRQITTWFRGTIIQYDSNSFIATFDGPSKAVQCSIELIRVSSQNKIQLSIGIDIKECMVAVNPINSPEISDFARVIYQQARPNQILITRIVKNLLPGVGLSFTYRKANQESKPNAGLEFFAVFNPVDSHSVRLKTLDLPENSFLKNVLHSIDVHLGDSNFGVEKLCREVGVSERQLQRKLKLIVDKSPIQLITLVRLYRAKDLILEQIHNFAEIAYQTGFSSPSYFSKCFKREFGFSPSRLLEDI